MDDLGLLANLPDEVLAQIRVGGNTAFEDAVQQKFQHAKSVLLQKHKDYGPKNISLAPGGALNGLRVRMWDKLARINNLVDNGAKPENESLKDSFLDLANYSIIAMMVLDGEWPSE
jgi:Nucleotide modification associated domain 1